MSGRGLTGKQKYAQALLRQRVDRDTGTTPVPQRITEALDSRGLYGPEVDRACGVEEPAVDLWETGELVPTREQVEALARLTGYPVGFFYRKWTMPAGVMWVCSRGRGGWCEAVDSRPDAVVLPLPGVQGTLW